MVVLLILVIKDSISGKQLHLSNPTQRFLCKNVPLLYYSSDTHVVIFIRFHQAAPETGFAGLILTFLVPHGNVGIKQGGEGALFGELGLCCQSVIPQSLNQHRRQVQCL